MYTPHFFSKIQMLLGPNLAHLLSAQDQGGLLAIFSKPIFWRIFLPTISGANISTYN